MLLTGAEIIIETLKNLGVDTVFGYPGGTAISVYDALYRNGEGIRHILTSHEQGATHAADGYARSTGKTGVCLVTSGPGATNLVTGIATAYMDSVPLVAITVNVATRDLGKDSFQEVDIAGVTMPVTKHNFIIREAGELAHTLQRAFKIASSGRPGPVLVDITKDATKQTAEYEPDKAFVSEKREDNATEEELKAAAKLITGSSRPVLLVGGGASMSDAGSRLETLIKMLNLPVVDTLMGKGVINGHDPRYMGMAGLYGTKAAKAAFKNADLIIAVGTRFSERVTNNSRDFAPKAKIIQIDIDRAELNKNIPVDIAIAGDASAVVEDLLASLNATAIRGNSRRREWLSELQAIAAKEREEREKLEHKQVRKKSKNSQAGRPLDGPRVVMTISRLADEGAIVATEVGLNQMWAATHFTYSHPRQLLTSGGLGTMGYGLGAAIGAAVGNPGHTVVNFAGDGCFRMNMNELLTAVRLNLPIVEIIFDNNSLGMVHMLQDLYYEGRHSQTEFTDEVNYAAISSAMGAQSFNVETVEELEKAYQEAVKNGGTNVIVCKIAN